MKTIQEYDLTWSTTTLVLPNGAQILGCGLVNRSHTIEFANWKPVLMVEQNDEQKALENRTFQIKVFGSEVQNDGGEMALYIGSMVQPPQAGSAAIIWYVYEIINLMS